MSAALKDLHHSPHSFIVTSDKFYEILLRTLFASAIKLATPHSPQPGTYQSTGVRFPGRRRGPRYKADQRRRIA
jgi:hypothetical protein